MASLAFARSKSSTSTPQGLDWEKFEGQVVHSKLVLRKLLGSTDYSGVFLSQSPNAQAKNIAVKLISCHGHAEAQTLLLQQAAKLTHPHLVRLLPGGPCQNAGMHFAFVVMEYAEEALGQVLCGRPLSSEETRETLHLILEALRDIHSKGFVHSHIKPSNILSISNQIKLSCDAALPIGGARPAHRALDVYDAPETGSARLATWSDVWSLGVTVVEVLTQQTPVLSPESGGDPIVPSMPQPFRDIARNCLRQDPLRRWTLAQIADCLNGTPVQAPAPEGAEEVETTTQPQASSPAQNAKAGTREVAAPETSQATGKTAPAPIAASRSPQKKRPTPHRKRGRKSSISR